MREIKSPIKTESFQTCVLVDKDNKISWCVYHPDDSGEQLIFTKNLTDIQDIEQFKNTSLEQIKEHLNIYGFEVEPEEYFGEVERHSKLPDEYQVKLLDVEFNKMFSIKFTL